MSRPHRNFLSVGAVAALLAVGLVAPAAAAASAAPQITPQVGPETGGTSVSLEALPIAQQFTMIGGSRDAFTGLGIDGRLYSWGMNDGGQLGVGNAAFQVNPIPVNMNGVLSGQEISSISASHAGATFVTTKTGEVFLWGENYMGSLGTGSTSTTRTPLALDMTGVLAGEHVTQVAVSQLNGYALTESGKVAAWGDNRYSALGAPEILPTAETLRMDSPVLVDLSPLNGERPIQVAANNTGAYLLTESGQVFGWGNLSHYNNPGGSLQTTPVLTRIGDPGALAGQRVVEIGGNAQFMFALLETGQLVSWGETNTGATGLGSVDGSTIPTPVVQSGALVGETVVRFAATGYTGYALTASGKIVAWGRNSSGEIGDGTTEQRLEPTLTDMNGELAGKTVVDLVATREGVYVLTSEGYVYSWGRNPRGQLGNSTQTDSLTPKLAARLTPVAVTFDALQASDVTPGVEGAATAVTPPHAAGVVDVALDYAFSNGATAPESTRTVISNGFRYAAAPTIEVGQTPDGWVDERYEWPVPVQPGNGPYTCEVTAGKLPAGLMLNENTCTLEGTPTESGTSDFTLTVTGPGGTTDIEYQINIAKRPAVPAVPDTNASSDGVAGLPVTGSETLLPALLSGAVLLALAVGAWSFNAGRKRRKSNPAQTVNL
ncbi:putative Ig domain-containing protein [Leucobacter sp. UT-8R-CII-1-4]|uniref:RCC1 domain-containing protein n=1 Tax=Leucobacter sp. UT-8R-CII-1-4 TaxID=3040075 RepID=UPI0024A94638|nr:putative Ig domain-containing protein [Leucobacter sp. UT-8R-CII-1-4]MDI6022621.1 putative Ig domain-containing protein [Leucobacter sp. UT-8R-CII-1-4]